MPSNQRLMVGFRSSSQDYIFIFYYKNFKPHIFNQPSKVSSACCNKIKQPFKTGSVHHNAQSLEKRTLQNRNNIEEIIDV